MKLNEPYHVYYVKSKLWSKDVHQDVTADLFVRLKVDGSRSIKYFFTVASHTNMKSLSLWIPNN